MCGNKKSFPNLKSIDAGCICSICGFGVISISPFSIFVSMVLSDSIAIFCHFYFSCFFGRDNRIVFFGKK